MSECCYIESDRCDEHGGNCGWYGFIPCEKDGEFVITTIRATPDGDGIAGPDVYSDLTYACGKHVGALLGYQPEATEPESIYWHVRPLPVASDREEPRDCRYCPEEATGIDALGRPACDEHIEAIADDLGETPPQTPVAQEPE